MIDIDSLTVKQLREIQAMCGAAKSKPEASPYVIGTAYLIRTVTHYLTGRVTAVTRQEVVLEDSAWVADTGRFHEALKTGVVSEVEPFPDGSVIVGRGAIVDAVPWTHKLPRAVK